MYLIVAMLVLVSGAQAGVVLDRIAVIVGRHTVKTSDIERDLRVTQFLNSEPLKMTEDEKRKAAERLIDQEIIRQEVISTGFERPPEAEGAELEASLWKDRYGGSQARLNQALARYQLSEAQLREQLLWQLTVLRFIDQRFKAGAIVSDEEVRAYYDQHLADLRRQYPKANGFDALSANIRSSLEGERVNQNFTDWLEQNRKRYRIDYRQEAFK
jgi:peptidyl-prolyl cis-trans isomerase SurA